MNLPDHVTRQQLTDAFAAMGLDFAEITLFAYESTQQWLEVDLRGPVSNPVIDAIALKIPIIDAPPQEADLLGELRSEGGAV